MSKPADYIDRYSALADAAYILGSSAIFILLFAVSRTFLLVRNSGLIADIPISALLISYAVGFRFDLLVTGYTMAPFLAGMFFPAGLSRRKWWNLWLGFALVLFSFLAVLEPDFYREFHTRLNSLVFQYLKEDPKTVISMLWHGFPVLHFLLLCGFMAVSAIAALRLVDRRTRKPDTCNSYKSRLLIAIVLILLGFVSMRGTVRFSMPLRWSDAFHSSHLFANHLALNGAFTLAKAAEHYTGYSRKNPWLDKMDEKEATDLVHKKLLLPYETLMAPGQFPLLRRFNPSQSVPSSSYRNVVLILMESLSAQRIGVFGNTLNVTPFFDELASEGLLFDHIFSNGTHTHQGMFAILGCFPNLPNYEYLMNQPEGSYRFSGLAKVLSGRNYDNVFIYNGDFAYDNQIGFFSAQGVSKFIGRNDFVNPRLLDPTWGVTDEDMFDRAFDEIVKLEKGSRPYYAILQTLSNHIPYSLPDPMPVKKVMVNGTEDEHLTAMRYSDYALGQFFKKIKGHGGFDDTLFVITGDHGFGGGALVTDMDLFRFHVPLLFIGKDIQARFGKINAIVGSQVDIVPTVMGMLGGSYVHHCWGRDLLALPEGDPGLAVIKPSGNDQMVAFIEGETILIKAPNTGPKLFRYRIRPMMSAESIDDPHKLQQMQKELNAYLQTATHALIENHAGHNDEMSQK
ncbi:MAG: LTA synthase family protein [Desulfobacterales bacterium]|nr:LTA synthase family protein [Desulfobacterales bacterium]